VSYLVDAVKSINPDAKFVLVGDDISNIEWIEETSPIDIELIRSKMEELREQYIHQAPRQIAYPSIEEQLDMLYWDGINGTTNWSDAITAVKAANPKPE